MRVHVVPIRPRMGWCGVRCGCLRRAARTKKNSEDRMCEATRNPRSHDTLSIRSTSHNAYSGAGITSVPRSSTPCFLWSRPATSLNTERPC